jgi:hypothetical protein
VLSRLKCAKLCDFNIRDFVCKMKEETVQSGVLFRSCTAVDRQCDPPRIS